MGGSNAASEIPLLSLFLRTCCQVGSLIGAVHLVNTKCSKASSARTETSSGVEGQMLVGFRFSVRIRTAKAWPKDPFDLRRIEQEVSEKQLQG